MSAIQIKNNLHRSCKAPDCINNTANRKDLTFFQFPLDKDRCQVWLALSGRHDLINEPHESMQHHVLCPEHFEPDQFEDQQKSKLIDSAVPTIFPYSASPQPPASPVDGDCISIKEEISDYDPDLPVDTSEHDGSVQLFEENDEAVLSEEEAPAVVKVVAGSRPAVRVPPGAKPITVTTADGQKRVLMAVPKEVYKSAVKTGKFSAANLAGASIQDAGQIKITSIQTCNKRKSSDEVNPEGIKKLKPLLTKPAVMISNAPRTVSKTISSGGTLEASKPAAPQTRSGVTSAVSLPPGNARQKQSQVYQVYQVAPDLPIEAKGVNSGTFDWNSLMPNGWQDWPVPLSVFLPAVVQLKANYHKLFPRKDRLDIETTLHLAAHYQTLSRESKSHVRARVHHFLKIMQLEKTKLSILSQQQPNEK